MIIKRLVLPPLLALLALLALCVPVSAHAILVRSEPADGTTLAAAPGQLRLWFSEPIALGFTTLELADGDGRRIPVQAHGDAASLALAVRAGEAAGAALVMVDLPKLAPNIYRLNWRTLSNNDLHSTGGSIVFGVGRTADSPAAAAVDTAPSPLAVALRWMNLGAVSMLVGALAVAWLAAKNREPRTENQEPAPGQRSNTTAEVDIGLKLYRLAFWSALLALAAGCALLCVQALAAVRAGVPVLAATFQIVSTTSYGLAWSLRQGLLIILVACIWLLCIPKRQIYRSSRLHMQATGPQPHAAPTRQFAVPPSSHAAPTRPHATPLEFQRAYAAALAALLLAIACAQALQSHATAFEDVSPLRVFADALHMLAAGLWSGGVLALAFVVVPLFRHGAGEARLAWATLRRFGALAAAALAALLVTGLFMAGQQVASLDALLTTFYGRTLLLKIALALGTALLGLHNASVLHSRVAALLRRAVTSPRVVSGPHSLSSQDETPPPLPSQRERGPGGEGRLAHTVRFEAAGALTLLRLAAGLSAAQPARGPEFDPPSEAADVSATTTKAADLVVTLSVRPNLPGRNFISLGVFNTRRPAPAPIEAVVVDLRAPGAGGDTQLPAEAQGNGHYQVVGDALTSAGDWQLTVVVKRPGLPDTVAVLPWTVAAPTAAPRPVLVSNRPLAPGLTLAALLLALLLLGVLAAPWLRRAPGGCLRALSRKATPCERSLPAEERVAQ
jgi:copper transport protein